MFTRFSLPFLRKLLFIMKQYTTAAFLITKYFAKTKLDCYILLSILQHTFHTPETFFFFWGGVMLTVEFFYSYVEFTTGPEHGAGASSPPDTQWDAEMAQTSYFCVS